MRRNLIIWMALALFVAYPLSAGPVQRFAKPWGTVYPTLYGPLFALSDRNPHTKAVMLRWVSLWEIPDNVHGRR